MSPSHPRKLELVCVLCNEALADVEKACTGLTSTKIDNGSSQSQSQTMASLLSETDSGLNEATEAKGAPCQIYGGYHSMAPETQNEVVATKCGHMFHQGCLRKHVHKTLIEGKGGSLFCPICTRPFQLNRLWHVVIPPTKAQRERYLRLNMMKEDNADMVKQLKSIRSQIAEEESRLKKLKEDAEHCLADIQQKQKLLDSVSGPTNKEMAELAKIHMKRQEILHVVTQHNADLLKLLAEESNISSNTAENMIGSPGRHMDSINHLADNNRNFLPSSAEDQSRGTQTIRGRGRGAETTIVHTIPSVPEPTIPLPMPTPSTKSSRRSRKSKGGKKKKKKKSSKIDKEKGLSGYPEFADFPMSIAGHGTKPNTSRMPAASKIRSKEKTRRQKEIPQAFAGSRKGDLRTADTLAKWKLESLKELMSFDNSTSDMSRTNEVHNELLPPPPPEFRYTYSGDEPHMKEKRGKGTSKNHHGSGAVVDNLMNSIHMPLSRKPPIMLHEALENDSDRQKH